MSVRRWGCAICGVAAASLVSLFCVPPLCAQTPPSPPPPPPPAPAKPAEEPPPRIAINAQLTALVTTGNAEAKTLGAGGEFVYRPDPWRYAGRLTFLQNEDDIGLSARSFLGLFRVDRKVTPRLSIFGQYDYLRDLFAGVEHRHTMAGGLSYAVIDGTPHRLTIDGGLGFEHEDRIAEESSSSAIALAGTTYRWDISKTSVLTDELRFILPFDDTSDWKLDHAVALTASLTSILSLRVSNTIRYAHEPVIGFETTDSITSIAFVVSYKRPGP